MRNFLVMVFLVAVFKIHAKSYVKRDDQGGTILDHLGGLKESILNDKSIPAAGEIEYINEVEDIDAELFEGDIVLGVNSDESSEVYKRNALRSRKQLWRTKIVPYEVTAELINDGYMDTINAAIAEFHNHSCIRWKPHENEPYWVLFHKSTGCWSALGFTGGKPQKISLGNGCNGKGIAMHEMLHTLGFRHEQSRPDRDKYVEIFWENIKPGKEGNFKKGALSSTNPLEASYDFSSIMHYGKRSFSATGKDTIEVIGNPDQPIGLRGAFSKSDIEELNALYDCSNPEHGWSSWSKFGPCDDECLQSRERFCSHEDLSNCPGANKRGVQMEKVECPHETCYAPLDGHWGRWSSWGDCSVSCDSGTHTRTRLCNDPAPKNGGKNCVGNSEDVKKCLLTVCHLGPYDTAFESEGMHGWELCDSPTDKPLLEWKIALTPTDTSGTGPDRDHTSGSGRYIYLETTYGEYRDTKCFYSPEIAPTTCKRFTFWYHMYGSSMGTLRVLVKGSDGSKRAVWERSCQQGLDWLPATVDISSETPFQIYFEGVRGTWHRSDIGIDDIKFTDCSASPSAPPARAQGSPDVCFSNPLGVSDPAIIPDSHMTASSEYKICFKPAFGRLDGHRGDGWCARWANGNKEWLQVDLEDIFKICGVASQGDFSGDQQYVSAFKLSYSFDGSDWTELKNEDGSEKIFQRNGGSDTTDQHELSSPVLARYVRFHPTARNKWNCMRVEVYGTVPLDGNWGSWSSWGACSATCDNGKRTRTRKCDSPAPKPGGKDCVGDGEEVKECEEMIDCDVGPYDTTFEIEGMHGWKLCASNTKPQWSMKSGQTPTPNTGPNGDHTKGGSGRYIYLETTNGKTGDTKCFYSPEIAPTTCKRFTFWYHMYGSSMGTLRVLVKSSDGSKRTVWERSCQQGLDWLPATVDISSETPFQIYFEGVRGTWHRSDIGIDDIKFTDCSASPSAPPARAQGSPDVCFSNPLGVSDPAIIPDSHMTASSEYKTCFKPAFGRLDRHRGDGWCSNLPRSNRDWLQVDLGDIFKICGVASQGDFSGDQQYVSAFKLSFSSNGNDWNYYEKEDGTQLIFQRTGGSTNTDQHELSSAVHARYVRFHPTARNKWNCMRVEVYGTAE